MQLAEINALIRAESPYPLIRPARLPKGPYIAVIGKIVGDKQHVAAVSLSACELKQARYPADILRTRVKHAVASLDRLLAAA